MTNPQLVVQQELKQLVVQQELQQIIIQGGPIVANILPFSVVATANGQTVFNLFDSLGNPIYYSQIICLFVMGTGQDPVTGDFTWVGNVVTLGATAPTINIGDLVFGSGMI